MSADKKDSFIVVGSGLIGARALAAQIAATKAEIVLLDAKEAIKDIGKEHERGIAIKSEPFVLHNEISHAPLHFFKEQPNYITGKKLPKKKRRK